MTILIIEDDLFLRDILSQKFGKAGFTVVGAVDAEEAFAALEKDNISLVLLDILLPGVDGQFILAKIKESKAWRSIPVVIVSNLDSPEEKRKALDAGAARYLLKAEHTPEEIVRAVNDVLAKQ